MPSRTSVNVMTVHLIVPHPVWTPVMSLMQRVAIQMPAKNLIPAHHRARIHLQVHPVLWMDDGSCGHCHEQGPKRKHCHQKSKRHSNKKKSLIKPTLPDKYSGAADLQAFHCFLTQGTAYVKYGYIEKK